MAQPGFAPCPEQARVPCPSRRLLDQLSDAHDELAAEMDNMELATSAPSCDLGDLTKARWRISQASLRRRQVAAALYELLAGRLDEEDLPELRDIRCADQVMMRRSTAHVSAWTTSLIRRDWEAYCKASRDIRAHMAAHMALEKQRLQSLLARFGPRGI